jgi:hypothetical protein
LRGDALAARGHAAGPSLLERQPAAKRQYRSIALANGIIVLGQTLRYRSLFVADLRLDPGDGILPCTTVTELIDCVTSTAVPPSAAICAGVARPAGQAFLTEMSQSCRGVRIRLDFCRKGRIAMGAGRWTWPPGETLRARLAMCGALGRASVNSGAANQRSPVLCRPFP